MNERIGLEITREGSLIGYIAKALLEQLDELIRLSYEKCGFDFSYIQEHPEGFQIIEDPAMMEKKFFHNFELLFSLKWETLEDKSRSVVYTTFYRIEMENGRYTDWQRAMSYAERQYLTLIKNGATPQEARSVLPNSIKTEVVMTGNYREWRHFLNLRAARATGPAHPQMEELTVPLLKDLVNLIPDVFDNIYLKYKEWSRTTDN